MKIFDSLCEVEVSDIITQDGYVLYDGAASCHHSWVHSRLIPGKLIGWSKIIDRDLLSLKTKKKNIYYFFLFDSQKKRRKKRFFPKSEWTLLRLLHLQALSFFTDSIRYEICCFICLQPRIDSRPPVDRRSQVWF